MSTEPLGGPVVPDAVNVTVGCCACEMMGCVGMRERTAGIGARARSAGDGSCPTAGAYVSPVRQER